MEDQIKKLRESGFSDEDIQIYINSQQSSASATPAGPVNPAEPMDVNKPPKVDETVPDYGKTAGTSMMETMATAGAAVAPYALPIAIGGAGLYGASTLKSGFNAMKESAAARTAQANAQMAATQGLQQRFDAREAARAASAAPAPTTASPILDARGQPIRPMAPPMATPPMAAPAATPPVQSNNWMAKAVQMAKQAGPIVEQYTGRAAQAMAPVARVAGAMSPYITAAQGLTYSKGLGPAVPSAGPYRGMEINPQTGRGWTPEELNAANAAAARGF